MVCAVSGGNIDLEAIQRVWYSGKRRQIDVPALEVCSHQKTSVNKGDQPMKIAMIGSGAAGSVFAAYLKRGGAELYLVDIWIKSPRTVLHCGSLTESTD